MWNGLQTNSIKDESSLPVDTVLLPYSPRSIALQINEVEYQIKLYVEK